MWNVEKKKICRKRKALNYRCWQHRLTESNWFYLAPRNKGRMQYEKESQLSELLLLWIVFPEVCVNVGDILFRTRQNSHSQGHFLIPMGQFCFNQEQNNSKHAQSSTHTGKRTKPETELFRMQVERGTNELFILFVLHQTAENLPPGWKQLVLREEKRLLFWSRLRPFCFRFNWMAQSAFVLSRERMETSR